MQKSMGKNVKRIAIGAAFILLLAVIGILYWMYTHSKTGLELDPNATIGTLPGIDAAQRQAELQKQLDESMIAFSINTSPVFESGKAEGNLMLENPGNNQKLLVAEIYADSTNELLYQSKAIQPGSYIENTKLDKVLDKGQYPATVYFKAYREEDASYIGQTGAAITITVLS